MSRKQKNDDYRVDLGNGRWYDTTPDVYRLNPEGIRKIEKLRGCRYVCEWNLTDAAGNAYDQPVLLFWNDVPHPQGSNWMALHHANDDWYVRDGITASRLPIK